MISKKNDISSMFLWESIQACYINWYQQYCQIFFVYITLPITFFKIFIILVRAHNVFKSLKNQGLHVQYLKIHRWLLM